MPDGIAALRRKPLGLVIAVEEKGIGAERVEQISKRIEGIIEQGFLPRRCLLPHLL